MTDDTTKTPKEGALADRPEPEPRLLNCPACGSVHLGESGIRSSKPGIVHVCARCGHTWQPSGHRTIGVQPDELDRMRLIHESRRIEVALDHFQFPKKDHAEESSFDRVLDALAASEHAGSEMEDERDTARTQLAETRRALDSLAGFVHTVCTPAGDAAGDARRLTPTERKILATADRLVQKKTPRAEIDVELTRLRADLAAATTGIQNTLFALFHDQVDSETGKPWVYCVVCDDQVLVDRPNHGREKPCAGADLQALLDHLDRPGETT